MKNFLVIILGLLLIVAGVMYVMLPAHSLPSFFPGHAPIAKHHYTHAAAALGLGLLCFVYTWFKSGKK